MKERRTTMARLFFSLGSLLGAMAVVAGAYGAHGGAKHLTPEHVITFSKAVRYQMHHALALLAVAWALSQWSARARLVAGAGWLFLAGILLFSGSLYLLAFDVIDPGYTTPTGGMALIAGWLLLAWATLKK
jgi:uncharacterized membrane protein YgdD (TMEM256/DUF423 family)